ncbi:MAG: PKD domain-containing protein [Chitinophagaceae bacterium]|nr:PKD domain-containing protein [Chitinophagaceae bacterium]
MKIYSTLKQLAVLVVLLTTSFLARTQNYNNIEFIENKGQWDSRIKYMGDVNAGAFYIRSGGFSVLQHNRQDFQKIQNIFHEHNSSEVKAAHSEDNKLLLRSHVYAVDFVGASKDIEIVPDKAIETYNNYFIGNDPSKWASKCRIFQGITMKNVYPNIDVRYYTDNGTLKYDIIAKPGADISKIAMRYEGADKLQVKNKELVVSTSVGELRESYPYTYQANGKERREVACKYVVKDNILRFDVKDYDPTATLVIDPFLIFCSFSGSVANNWGYTATYGPDGSFYGGGIVFGSGSFAITPGAFQTSFQGGNADAPGAIDIGIIKLSPTGSTRVYGTYIGGGGNEQPHSLIVDPQGQLILAGRTNSSNYPTRGAAIPGGGGYDIVVTKLNAAGSDLIGSLKIGGAGNDGVNISIGRNNQNSLQRNYGDDGRSEVIVDGAGNVYVASSTQSPNSPASGTFPVTAGAFQTTYGGGAQDAVVLKFPPDLSGITFASYLGGSGNDAGYVLSISPSTGDIYVAGGTESTNFPGNQAGTVGTTIPHSNIDGFVAQISNNGATHIRSTYIGTTGIDQVYGIQFDRLGFPYVMGQTTGAWPVINATYVDANAKQFIGKLRPDLSNYVYSTTFGTGSTLPNISPTAFLVDRCENIYVSGWGGDILGNSAYPNAGTTGLRTTPDAYQSTTDNKDFYFFVMKRDAVGPNPLYASFFGQSGGLGDHVDGGTSRFDNNGIVYQGVCANCNGGASFPITPGVAGPVNGALPGCNLGMIKMSFNLAGVGSDVESAIGGVPRDTAGCLPLTVQFTDLIRNATEYVWNFGDGTGDFGPYAADTGYTQPHTFFAVGTYRVMLIAINPAACNLRDTSYINIRVGDLKANLNAEAVKLPPCESFNYQFNNLSTTDQSRPFRPNSFIWKFGDGSAPVVGGMNSVTHTYPGPGSYTAWLILTDSAYCNYPDSFRIQIEVAINVDAGFSTDPAGCAPYSAEFDNSTVAGQTYEWNFGDPGSPDNTSTDFEPTHLYSVPGTYTVTLVATNLNTCNVTDTSRFTIVVYEKPTAAFSYTPVAPVENTPNVFNNNSSPTAVSFKWLFGDGDSLLTNSRGPVEHQYNATGTFDACLIAYNQVGCPDTTCQPVSTIIVPALDVPNAFTPGRGDENSVIFVRGFGIAKMRFIIWNRWGQKVFETNNRLQGWDGKVKGVLQPMDVYAYTLEVEFFDGIKASRKGDITLIR